MTFDGQGLAGIRTPPPDTLGHWLHRPSAEPLEGLGSTWGCSATREKQRTEAKPEGRHVRQLFPPDSVWLRAASHSSLHRAIRLGERKFTHQFPTLRSPALVHSKRPASAGTHVKDQWPRPGLWEDGVAFWKLFDSVLPFVCNGVCHHTATVQEQRRWSACMFTLQSSHSTRSTFWPERATRTPASFKVLVMLKSASVYPRPIC